MAIVDKVVSYYVRNFIMPGALVFDKPGFVDFKISGKTQIFARQLLVPESFFIELEKNIVDNFGEEGKKKLYSLGKRFGYRFSQLGRFENIKDHPGNSVKKWITLASKFVEGTYASEITYDADVPNKVVDYHLKNFVICRELGFDLFLATGGAAGVIAWILQDPDIEGRLYDSKKKGKDHFCRVKCANYAKLLEEFKDTVYSENNVSDLSEDLNSYKKFNTEVNIPGKKSIQSYINSKLFSYRNGILNYQNNRFFLMEVSGLYLVELTLNGKDMQSLLFKVAKESGFKLLTNFGKSIEDVLDLLCALGWGELSYVYNPSAKKYIVTIKYFPWAGWYNKVSFTSISGLLSGVFSQKLKKDVNFTLKKADLTSGSLSLLFES